MRINYSDDEDYPGQFALWNANCQRSIKGAAGQRELRELEAALVALPGKRLIAGELADGAGGVCAIGCYAQHKGTDLSTCDPDDESDAVGVTAGMPPLVAWRIVELNDFTYRDVTEETRYAALLAWTRAMLLAPAEPGR